MHTEISVADLDKFLSNFAKTVTYDSMAATAMNKFRLAVPEGIPADPFSNEYAQFQINLYSQIAGKRYALENESVAFDVDEAARIPFPYSSGNAQTVGVQFTAIGALLRSMDLHRGARILEFGAGWGNTSIALARAGYNVTAVDLEPRFCELIRRRAASAGVKIETINEDFFWVESFTGEPYDAVVFFECFHHCADHLRLLRALHTALKPKGRIFFGAEPVTNELPMPWGIRLDGESLWAIRTHGWLELGFTQDYFTEALLATGWDVTPHLSYDHFAANVWEASRFDEKTLSFSAASDRISSPTGVRVPNGWLLTNISSAWGFHGPYATVPSGKWLARVYFYEDVKVTGIGTLDVCSNDGKMVHAMERFNFDRLETSVVAIPFSIPRPLHKMEIRLHCDSNVSLKLKRVEFVRV